MPDTDKPYSDDIKVLAADLGADTMYFLARTRQCPKALFEPSPHILTFEEMKRMAEARISHRGYLTRWMALDSPRLRGRQRMDAKRARGNAEAIS